MKKNKNDSFILYLNSNIDIYPYKNNYINILNESYDSIQSIFKENGKLI